MTNATNSTNQNVAGLQNTFDQLNPQYQTLTQQAMGNAGQAMTLGQAQTANNAVEQGIQGMYNQQAQGITNQGLADYGELAALGGQATANTIGGAGQPITGGQMAALQNQNMSQASGEFGQAQNYANQLKNAGLQAGINQSNTMYQYGQQAENTAQGALANQGNFENNTYNTIGGLQNQEASNIYGAQTGLAAGTYGAKPAKPRRS